MEPYRGFPVDRFCCFTRLLRNGEQDSFAILESVGKRGGIGFQRCVLNFNARVVPCIRTFKARFELK